MMSRCRATPAGGPTGKLALVAHTKDDLTPRGDVIARVPACAGAERPKR
jgi:hypothetical protein